MFSIISSFRNEEKNCERFNKMLKKIKKILDIKEAILIDNGSTDSTIKELRKIKVQGIRIKVYQNKKNSGYGEGFTKAFLKSTMPIIITVHSDLQFDLINFSKKNKKEIYYCIKNNINIFPKRINREFLSNVRSFILKIILSIFNFIKVIDFNGHPKFLIKDNFKKLKYYPKNFAFDYCLYWWLAKNKKKINYSLVSSENKRLFGETTWDKSIIKQIIFLFKFLNEVKVFKKNFD